MKLLLALKKKVKGFTLIEVVIITSIIALLASLSVILMLNMFISANEAGAQKGLDTFRTAMEKFRNLNNAAYPNNIVALTPDYVDSALAGGTRKGYTYTISNATADTYTITAAPQTLNVTGKRSFFVDQSGEIQEV